MFGRRFDYEGTSPRSPFFGARLFGKHVTGACDWSKAHTETKMPEMDRTKFELAPHPLEQEGGKRKLEPTPEWQAEAVKARRVILNRAGSSIFKKVLEETEAKETIAKIGEKVSDEYIHDFRNFIAGIGKRSDYVKGGIPLTAVGQGKPLSRDKSVVGFIDRLTGRVIDYYAEIANMKMRGPGVGRYGGPATMKDLWLFFKYVIRNEPVDPEDFMFADDKVDNALVGNQKGITDEPTRGDQLAEFDRDRPSVIYPDDPAEVRLRGKNVDAQTRRNRELDEQMKDVEDEAVVDLPAAPGTS